MSKSKFFTFIIIVALGFNFIGCDNEPIDPAISLENPEAEACASPALLAVSDFIGGNKVNVSWDGDGETWQIQYGIKNFAIGSGTSLTATSNPTSVTGLDSTKEYDFYIRTVCSATEFSEWIGPVAVGNVIINTCDIPSNVTAIRGATNSTVVNVTWASTASSNWEVQYGAAGFALGTGTIVPSTTPSKQITGLLAANGYDFYVRTVCSATSSSTWAGPVHVDQVGAPVVAGDYWPTAINNRWTYDLNGTSESVVKIVSLDNVAGNPYYTFDATVSGGASATQRIRKSNGNYYMRIESITTPAQNGLPPSVTTGNETIVLKDNVAVGATWTDTYVQSTTYQGLPAISLNFSITCTILEKGASVQVRGVTYTDVIKMKRVQTITGIAPSTNTAVYYYAKNIGPVKIENDSYYQNLMSYTLN